MAAKPHLKGIIPALTTPFESHGAVALRRLSERLFEVGVLPYYLHLLDRVAGAAHYEVPESRGREIMRELLAMLPGYLVPKLVREIPGEPSKTPVF